MWVRVRGVGVGVIVVEGVGVHRKTHQGSFQWSDPPLFNGGLVARRDPKVGQFLMVGVLRLRGCHRRSGRGSSRRVL